MHAADWVPKIHSSLAELECLRGIDPFCIYSFYLFLRVLFNIRCFSSQWIRAKFKRMATFELGTKEERKQLLFKVPSTVLSGTK